MKFYSVGLTYRTELKSSLLTITKFDFVSCILALSPANFILKVFDSQLSRILLIKS